MKHGTGNGDEDWVREMMTFEHHGYDIKEQPQREYNGMIERSFKIKYR